MRLGAAHFGRAGTLLRGPRALRRAALTARDVELSAWIAAPPARVFRALTAAEELAKWLASKAESDPRPDGALRLTWEGIGTGSYRFLRVEPERELAFTWEKGGAIEFRLKPERGGTSLALTLRAVPFDGEELDCYTMMCVGWTKNLCNLKTLLERGWDLRADQPAGGSLA